jgi:hypothetical protein
VSDPMSYRAQGMSTPLNYQRSGKAQFMHDNNQGSFHE